MAETASEVSRSLVPTRMRQVYARFADVVERVHDFDGFFVRDFGVGSGVVLKR